MAYSRAPFAATCSAAKKPCSYRGCGRASASSTGTRNAPSQPPESGAANMPTLIVFCHLRWNFVYQRPQHLLSRLARNGRVVFVEEPMVGEAEQRLEKFSPVEGVEVWRPHVTGTAP